MNDMTEVIKLKDKEILKLQTKLKNSKEAGEKFYSSKMLAIKNLNDEIQVRGIVELERNKAKKKVEQLAEIIKNAKAILNPNDKAYQILDLPQEEGKQWRPVHVKLQ